MIVSDLALFDLEPEPAPAAPAPERYQPDLVEPEHRPTVLTGPALDAVRKFEAQQRVISVRHRMRPRRLVKLECDRAACAWTGKMHPTEIPTLCPSCGWGGTMSVTAWVSR